MPERIRGLETHLSITEEGVGLLEGSFVQVVNFRWNPRQDLTDTSFIGEDFDRSDTMIHGYDFSFSIHQRDKAAIDFYMRMVQRQADRGPLTRMTAIFTKFYRDTAGTSAVLRFSPAIIKLDSEEMGGRKEYIVNNFSGKAETLVQR